MNVKKIFKHSITVEENMIFLDSVENVQQKNQAQTQETFSEKWSQFEQGDKKEEVYIVT